MAVQILMPALSPTMEEGKLAKWLVKEGDTVKAGDILAEIETDKATMEYEAVDEGIVGKILVAEGAEGVKVATPIAILLEAGETIDNIDIPKAMDSIKKALSEAAPAAVPAAAGKPAAAPAAAPVSTGGRVFASPLARKIAALKGIDLAGLKGSGPRGRVVKADVEHAKAGAAPAAAASGTIAGLSPLPDAKLFYAPDSYVELPNDMMRRSIAKRLAASAGLIPHITLAVDCRIDELLKVRAHLNAAAPKNDTPYKLSVNDFIIKAVATALAKVPEVNASWTDAAILQHKHADIGVAVAVDFGLITPIVTRAEEKGLVAISNEVKSLVARAKEKKLKPSEYEGGSFSISNLGMFGIKNFAAIINPPQAAILAVGAGEKQAVVVGDRIEIGTVMTITLSLDHRVADGAVGARFLQVLKQYIEDPAEMLL